MNGQELIEIINKDTRLLYGDVKDTIKMLLRKQLINPSTLIDAQVEMLVDEQYKANCHYEDACISSIQLFNGQWTGKDYESAKGRFLYNTSFSKIFPNMNNNNLSESEKKYWSDFFERTYGFRPEEE